MRAISLLGPSSRRFRREQAQLAPRGTPAYLAVVQVLNELAAELVLPGPDDHCVMLPMSVPARRVPGTDLLLAYIASSDVLTPLSLLRRETAPSR